MSYVRGAKVELSTIVRRNDGAIYTPDELVLTVEDPTGVVTEQKLSDGALLPDADVQGRYVGYVDTTPAPGTWQYQFEVTDDAVRTPERRQFTVKDRLPAATV